MRIEKKAWPDSFEAVLSGKKRFDARLADFECNEGDILFLREWDPATGKYTGRTVEKKVAYVYRTKGSKYWTQEDVDDYGFQIISLE